MENLSQTIENAVVYDRHDAPSLEAFQDVCDALERGESLKLAHVGRVFGQPFWELIVYCFLDSHEAARAIQGAINRLRDENPNDDEDDDEYED